MTWVFNLLCHVSSLNVIILLLGTRFCRDIRWGLYYLMNILSLSAHGHSICMASMIYCYQDLSSFLSSVGCRAVDSVREYYNNRFGVEVWRMYRHRGKPMMSA